MAPSPANQAAGDITAGAAAPRARLALWIRATWPWWVLWPWALAWVAFQAGMAGQSWHFFAQGGRLLFANAPGAGLQLYATHPDLQIGPLTLAVSGALQGARARQRRGHRGRRDVTDRPADAGRGMAAAARW